jgi:hypothetical protein
MTDTEPPNPSPTISSTQAPRRRGLLRRVLLSLAITLIAAIALLVLGCWLKPGPDIYWESFWRHEHCILQVNNALRMYSAGHDLRYPVSSRGYGDALLLLADDLNGYWYPVGGPGYSDEVFKRCLADGSDVPEAECGRVYVQGLRYDADLEVVVLFDKLASPGDHTHGPRRFFAPLVREVLFNDGHREYVPLSKWPEFAKRQIELLVAEGISREEANRLYREVKDP